MKKESKFLVKYESIKQKGFRYYMVTRTIIAVIAFMLTFSIESMFEYGILFNHNLFQFFCFLVFSLILGFFISKNSRKNYKKKYDILSNNKS